MLFPLLGARLVQEQGSGDHTVQHLSLQFGTFGWAHGVALTRASGFAVMMALSRSERVMLKPLPRATIMSLKRSSSSDAAEAAVIS